MQCNQNFVPYGQASNEARRRFDKILRNNSNGSEATIIVEGNVICNYRCTECLYNFGRDMTAGKQKTA